MQCHIGISLEFLWQHIGNLFLSTFEFSWRTFGTLLEFSVILETCGLQHILKLLKLDGNYIGKFLGIRLELNFGTVLEFLRKHERNSFEIFWNRIKLFGMILEKV